MPALEAFPRQAWQRALNRHSRQAPDHWLGYQAQGGLIERIWHAGNKLIYRRAEHTIVLCESANRLTDPLAAAKVHCQTELVGRVVARCAAVKHCLVAVSPRSPSDLDPRRA